MNGNVRRRQWSRIAALAVTVSSVGWATVSMVAAVDLSTSTVTVRPGADGTSLEIVTRGFEDARILDQTIDMIRTGFSAPEQ
ncbi:hypothetical protein HZU40_17575 [Mycolicibacterium fluoranthenivorans]|uniref:Uncharacterized protein n=1 Tax=Mycolicibacterium fluoranthenivorans TaxID=258505 RepID=A0A7G8P6Z2_9MYCO|nr:hypothetical protein [Mycolicibacterium fluoranthenivorans]QNJ90108.1 hypothetical protein HZU40_17575 [Mycolicibacterium fluoranthenivorans]